MAGINFPLGAADVPAQPVTTGAAAYTITNTLTEIILAGLTGALTINLTLDAKLPLGSQIMIRCTQGAGAQTVTLGTGFYATMLAAIQTLTSVANKVDTITLEFDGTVFQAKQAWVNIK